MVTFITLAIVLVLVIVDGKDISKRIIGGEPVREGEFKWMARLIAPTHGCGAVLIHPNVALTAAHCVCNMTDGNCDGIIDGQITLKVGGLKITGQDAVISIPVDKKNIKLLLERSFNVDMWDLAIIIIGNQGEDALISATAEISLPRLSPRIARTDEECYILGWGFSGNCLDEPPEQYRPCATNSPSGEDRIDQQHLFGECIARGCCHYKNRTSGIRLCYYQPGLCDNITRRQCRRLTGKILVSEEECDFAGCCYNQSSQECYDNQYIENYYNKVLEKLDVKRNTSDRGTVIHVYDKDPNNARGTCAGDSGGPYICRSPGSKIWKLYGIASTVHNCGVDATYWDVFASLSFIISNVPADVEQDLTTKAGLYKF